MKRPLWLALPLLAACAAAAPAVTGGWTATEGLQNPESAYLGAEAIYVSNVAGEPADKDGRGWISKLDFQGRVVAAKWVQGLNAPKGLRAHGGTLWTADIDEILGIDIAAAKVATRVKVDGAKFLNDVACGADGTVYVSDMALSRIYMLKGGILSIFADGPELDHPNGLLVEGGALVVAAWGKPEPDFSTKVPGRLYKLDLATKKKTLITPEPLGNLDGLESDGRGGYVLTDWMAGKVFHVAADGKPRLLKQFTQGTADHALIPGVDILILPHMVENKVIAITLDLR